MIETLVDGIRTGRDFGPEWSEVELALQVAEEVRSAASQQQVVAAGGGDV